MDPEFVYIINYSCPRCHAALEARASESPGWLRCPACGRASLPPEHNRVALSPFVHDETLMIGAFANGGSTADPLPIRPREMAPLPAREAPRTPTSRLLLGSGFFLSLILFVVGLLDSNRQLAGLFGLIAVVCAILLTHKTGRSPGD